LLADIRAEPDPDVTALASPTLCLYGAASSCLAGGQQLSTRAPHAKLVVLAGGHYLHLDARAEMTEKILEHLGD
jgi:pimeloyl-ACP methyl ester carboxylesterase